MMHLCKISTVFLLFGLQYVLSLQKRMTMFFGETKHTMDL